MIDPIIGGLAMQALNPWIKKMTDPQASQMMNYQKRAMAAKQSYIPYYNQMMNTGKSQQNMYLPQANKMASMGIESAMKPLSETDVFKGTGAANAIIQRQGDTVRSNMATGSASRGLYGPSGYGLGVGVNPNAAIDAQIAGNIGQFSNNWESTKGDRFNAAADRAMGLSQAGTNMANQGAQGAVGLWGQFGQDAQNIGAQELQARQLADQQASGMMGMLSGYWTGMEQRQQAANNLRQSQDQTNRIMSMLAANAIKGKDIYGPTQS
jgi:hypothetical protein